MFSFIHSHNFYIYSFSIPLLSLVFQYTYITECLKCCTFDICFRHCRDYSKIFKGLFFLYFIINYYFLSTDFIYFHLFSFEGDVLHRSFIFNLYWIIFITYKTRPNEGAIIILYRHRIIMLTFRRQRNYYRVDYNDTVRTK